MISILPTTTIIAIFALLLLAAAAPSEGFSLNAARPVAAVSTALRGCCDDPDCESNAAEAEASPSQESTRLLQALLWDMDGVLAETERDAHRVAFNKVFDAENLGTNWDIDGYGKLLEVGGGKERMTAHWNAVGWPEALKDLSDEDRQAKVKEFHLKKTDVFNGLIQEGTVPLRPGVQRLMDEATSGGITIAVCSTSNEKAVTNLVQTLLGAEMAENISIFAGDVVANKKPAPDIYNLAVDTLKLNKRRCCIVEDSGIGWGAAKAAGIACVVTKSVYTAHEDFTGADMIVTDLDRTDEPDEASIDLATIEGFL